MSLTAELFSIGPGARPAGRVEDVRLVHPGSMDQGEEVTSDSACLGSNNSEHGIGSDCGINRVSTCGDRRHRGLGRQDMWSRRGRSIPVERITAKRFHLSGEARECGD